MARRRRGMSWPLRMAMWFALIAVVGFGLRSMGIHAKPAGLLGRLHASYTIIDLPSGEYKVSPAVASGPARAEGFSAMIDRLQPVAAICGTYYDADYRPLGDIVIGGKVISRGCQRQGIGFTSAGKVRFIERKGRSRFDWRGCRSGIACGPRLIRSGRKDINVKRDGFSAVAARIEARRCAVGVTKDGKLILCVITDSVTLDQLAEVMLELGATNAVNLDGGRMCALYENGQYRVRPVSPMSNILAVYQRKQPHM